MPTIKQIEWIAGLLITVLLCAGSYITGVRHERVIWEAKVANMKLQASNERQAAIVQAVNQAQETAKALNQVSQKAEEHQQQVKVVYKTIHDEVIKYAKNNSVPADCKPDADFVRIWERANAGPDAAQADHPGQPAPAVPGPVAQPGGTDLPGNAG